MSTEDDILGSPPGKGHNSTVGGITAGQLRSYIERIERLTEEKAALATDITEVFSEAKANGFDTKTMRQVLALRKKDPQDRTEQQALLDLYLRALGMAPPE